MTRRPSGGKNEFSGAIKRATAERLLLRLERIEAGEQDGKGQLGR
jgi:hypothetical protein